MTDTAVHEAIPARLLLDPEVIEEPYGFYARLRAEAPVWRVPGTSIVVVSTFEAISQAVLRTEDLSSNIKALVVTGEDGTPEVMPFDMGDEMQVLATADPPVHTLHRSTVFPELVAKRMATLEGEIEELADAALDRALADDPVEFVDVANAVPIRVVSRLIGFRDEDPDVLLAAAFASTGLLAGTRSFDDTMQLVAETFETVEWVQGQVEAAAADGREGLLSLIAGSVARGEISLEAGVAIMQTLLSAGGESTTSLLGNAAHLLATQPGLQRAVRADRELLTPFIEEALRLESSFRYHMRHAPHDTELGGVEIPAGSTVLLFWGAANRDPAEYGERADEVQLDRKGPRHHVGFGRGIHLCVGAPLARLETKVVLNRFLDRTADFVLDPDRAPVREHSLMVRRFTSLPLRVTPA